MTGKKPYSIHKRTLKKGKAVYYVQFRKPDGSWSNAKSTGQTSKSKAEAWAINYLQAGKISFQENVTFGIFAKGFFSWDSEWAMEKRITGNRISEKWCLQKQKLVNKYLMSVLKNIRLSKINKQLISKIRNDLFFEKKLAGTSVNHILDCLRQILVHAEEQSLIQAVPQVKRVVAKPKSETGILTMNEVQRLFFETDWPDYVAYVCNLTAAITGMRKSELLGLQLKNVHDGYLDVSKA